MKNGLAFLVIGVVFTLMPFKGSAKPESTLRFLNIVHRHGERAPIETYPLDPYKNDSYWPDGREELLKIGKVNMYELGKFIRKRYDGFIPTKYKASDILVRSTATNRAIMSAQLVLTGIYPPVDEQIWNPNLLWQPIPVQVLDPSNDDMLCVSRACPRVFRDHENFRAGRYQAIRDQNQEIIKYLSNHTGLDFHTDSDLSTVYDNLLIEDEQGLKLPEWTKNVYPDRLSSLYWGASVAFKKNPTYTKINSGVLINDILMNLQKKRDEKESFVRILNEYSAHDSTIIGLWRGLRIVEEEPRPSFGALFIMELHEIEGRYFVNVLYKNRATDKDIHVVSIKDCTTDSGNGLCDLDTLVSLMKPAMVTDYDKECFSPTGPALADLPAVDSC